MERWFWLDASAKFPQNLTERVLGRGFMYKLLAVLFLLAATVWAQVTSGRLEGTVRDPNGAVVPAAHITVVNVETGATFSVDTSDRGAWAVPSLPTATYKV